MRFDGALAHPGSAKTGAITSAGSPHGARRKLAGESVKVREGNKNKYLLLISLLATHQFSLSFH